MNARLIAYLLPLLFVSASTSYAEAPVLEKTSIAELREMEMLSEIMRHLYRWNLDESDFDSIEAGKNLEFQIQLLNP